MLEFRPLTKVPLAHLLNSSFAVVVPVWALVVVLRTAGEGRAARAAVEGAATELLVARINWGAAAAGPVGIFTFPPAPTVDQGLPLDGPADEGLLARSAYRFPPETPWGGCVTAAAASFNLRDSSSR